MSRHLLLIGAQRSGSTYVTGLLRAHPDVAVASPERPEPKVFLSPELSARGPRWYRETYFAHAGPASLLLDKSTSYLEHPDAAARAASVLGTADILAVLRDPVHRAVSNWRFSTDHGHETRGLEAALAEDIEHTPAWDRSRTSVSPFAYLERGRYADQLAAWWEAFPDTLAVVFLAELLTGEAGPALLYDAIGLDPAVHPPRRHQPVNASEASAPDLPEHLVARLRAYFADNDRALARRLGRSLPWPTAA